MSFSSPEKRRSPFDLTQGRSCVVLFSKGYEIQRSLETAKETVRQLGSGDAGRGQYHQSSFRCRPPCGGEDEEMQPLTMPNSIMSTFEGTTLRADNHVVSAAGLLYSRPKFFNQTLASLGKESE